MTKDEIRAFVGPAREVLDGEVLVGAEKIAWLLAPPELRPILSDTIEWHADRAARGPNRLLPDELQQSGHAPVHVFLAVDGAYVNAGRAHLGSYNSIEARLTLDEPMSYETWLAIGGHVGFNATLDSDAGEETEWFPDAELELPRSQTLSHAVALEVVATYLRDGTRSDRVSWSSSA